MANLYVEDGNYPSAKEIVNRFLEKNPENSYASDMFRLLHTPDVYVAFLLINQGEMEKASGLLRQFLQKNPRNTDALLGLGSIYFHQEMYEDASDSYCQVLAQQPRSEEAQYYLAKILSIQGRWEDALDFMESQQFAEQDSAPLLKLRIELYIQAGQHNLAEAAIRHYLGKYPEDIEIYLIAGNFDYQMGNKTGSKEKFLQVLRLDPYNELARENLNIILNELGE